MSQLSAVADQISRLEGVRDKYRAERSRIDTEISDLRHSVEIDRQCATAVRLLLQNFIDLEKDGIRDLITEGLQAIFEDQDLSFKINTSIKRGRVNIDFSVFDGLKGVEGNILDSFGGGIANIVSLIFRFITILRLGLHKFIILDESLSNVSEEYIDNAGQFLKALCEKTGFDILLVTHQPRFLSYTDTSYMGELKGSELVLKENMNYGKQS